jgi:hypothetical protein
MQHQNQLEEAGGTGIQTLYHKTKNIRSTSYPRFNQNKSGGFLIRSQGCDEHNAGFRAIHCGVFSKLLATVSGQYQAKYCPVSNK